MKTWLLKLTPKGEQLCFDNAGDHFTEWLVINAEDERTARNHAHLWVSGDNACYGCRSPYQSENALWKDESLTSCEDISTRYEGVVATYEFNYGV